MVRSEDFNPYVIVRFLRGNGIDAWLAESDDGFGYASDDPERASNALFACVCLRASISYDREAAYWCGGQAMIAQRSRRAPVVPLSARASCDTGSPAVTAVMTLRARQGVRAGAIRRLESGSPVDKLMLAPLAAALGVPLCRLVCGEHSCAERACVPASGLDA